MIPARSGCEPRQYGSESWKMSLSAAGVALSRSGSALSRVGCFPSLLFFSSLNGLWVAPAGLGGSEANNDVIIAFFLSVPLLNQTEVYYTFFLWNYYRWATHGAPSDMNCHPQRSSEQQEFIGNETYRPFFLFISQFFKGTARFLLLPFVPIYIFF